MRPALAPLLLAPLIALAAPDRYAAFEPALEQLPAAANETEALGDAAELDLVKRQCNTCATNYYACSNLGAPGLCCPRTAICSADQRGAVACCPQGVACTGALGPATAGPLPTPTPVGSFVPAQTTTQPFSQGAGGASAGSTVPVRLPRRRFAESSQQDPR